MKKLISFLLIIVSLFSCKENKINKSFEKDIYGNWQLKYDENGFHAENNELDIGIYQELYINNDSLFIYTTFGFTYMFEYKIGDDMSLLTDYTVLQKDAKIKVSEDKLVFNFPNSPEVVYEKIEKGILPKVYMEDEDLIDCYYESFYMRQEKYLKSGVKVKDNL